MLTNDSFCDAGWFDRKTPPFRQFVSILSFYNTKSECLFSFSFHTVRVLRNLRISTTHQAQIVSMSVEVHSKTGSQLPGSLKFFSFFLQQIIVR